MACWPSIRAGRSGPASRLFVECGYERTTIRAVAKAAGVDGGLVMHYFGSKRELFQRVTHGRPGPELSGTADQVTEQILARLAEMLTTEPVQRSLTCSNLAPEG
jgi:AcrR family transcriptional regulator